MRCRKCKKSISKKDKFCIHCGTENDMNDREKKSTLFIMISVIVILILFIGSCIIKINEDKATMDANFQKEEAGQEQEKNKDKTKAEEKNTEGEAIEIKAQIGEVSVDNFGIDDYYLLDYFVISNIFVNELNKYNNAQLTGCEFADIDDDNTYELCMNANMENQYSMNAFYVFEGKDIRQMSLSSYTGSAYYDYYFSDDLNTVVSHVDKFGESYAKWNGNNWSEIICRKLESVDELSYEIGEETVSEDDYDRYVNSLGIRNIKNQSDQLNEVVIQDELTNVDDNIAQYLKNHQKKYYRLDNDIDGDGENEIIFVVTEYMKEWMENLNRVECSGLEVFGSRTTVSDNVAFILKETKNGININVSVFDEIGKVSEVEYSDNLIIGYDYRIKYEYQYENQSGTFDSIRLADKGAIENLLSFGTIYFYYDMYEIGVLKFEEDGIASVYNLNDDGSIQEGYNMEFCHFYYKIDEEAQTLTLNRTYLNPPNDIVFYYVPEKNILVTDVQYYTGEGEVSITTEGNGAPYYYVIFAKESFPGMSQLQKESDDALQYAKFGGSKEWTILNDIYR